MQQRKTEALEQIGKMEAERKKFIVPARADNDQAAREQLAEIDGRISAARRDMADDEAAIAEITRELQPLRAQLAIEQHKAKRQQLRKQVQIAAAQADANRIQLQKFKESVSASIDDASRIGKALQELADEARELGLEIVPSTLTQTQGLITNVLGAIQKPTRALPYTDATEQLDRFAAQLDSIASQL